MVGIFAGVYYDITTIVLSSMHRPRDTSDAPPHAPDRALALQMQLPCTPPWRRCPGV